MEGLERQESGNADQDHHGAGPGTHKGHAVEFNATATQSRAEGNAPVWNRNFAVMQNFERDIAWLLEWQPDATEAEQEAFSEKVAIFTEDLGLSEEIARFDAMG